MSKVKFKTSPGVSWPLGATLSGEGVNFAIMIMDGQKVTLSLYKKNLKKPIAVNELDPHINKTGNIWHLHVRGILPGDAYEYKISTHEFQDVVLLDPYSKAYYSNKKWGQKSKLRSTKKQNVLRISSVSNGQFNWEDDKPLNLPLRESIIYEMHVRGFTQHKTSKVSHPGTFKGVIEKIPYLKDLGITAVELLPVMDFDENSVIQTNPITGKPLKNYWGYDPISFFALKNTYATNSHPAKAIFEFRTMVKALHKAGIEIIMDVVFNHSAEGDQNGPILNFKGLAKKVYYHIKHDSGYSNFSGCGNTINCNHPVVMDMIVKALRYWVSEMHVDGFRFDLASILCRDREGEPSKSPPIIKRISNDPILSKTKLIAEPWDAAGFYLVGDFPGGKRWLEWNGIFRDEVRRFVRGEENLIPNIARRLFGSSDLYEKNERSPQNSINFLSCHDGFPLADLVTYNEKNNYANGEKNQDGENNNHSANYGFEGATKDPEINELRLRQIKNMTAILMLSQGIPMFNAGDEFGRTQGGNNNAYCQDNKISWLDWSLLKKNNELYRFYKMLIHFRKGHSALQRTGFKVLTHNGIAEVSWHGTELTKPDWNLESKTLALLLTGKTDAERNIYIMINGENRDQNFRLPKTIDNKRWKLVLDTSLKNSSDFIMEEADDLENQKEYALLNRSIALFIS